MGTLTTTGCRFAAVAALIVAAAACANTDGKPSALPPLGESFNCDHPIEVVAELPDSYVIVADVVALPGDGGMLQRGRVGPDNDAGSRRAFSKMGLLLRPGTTFQIHVAPDSQQNALFRWGNLGGNGPVGSIVVGSCPGDTNDWLVYAGGVWTLEPACAELVVLTAETVETLRLPLGAPCT
jgi:hypothetical protein